jgi:carbamoyl-phosphate synthase large subunit
VLIDSCYPLRSTPSSRAIDVDACATAIDVFVAGIMEHIEEAGIHSGDSACSLPPYALRPRSSPSWSARPRRWPSRAQGRGLMNVQYAIKDGVVYVLEVNPRASRTVPFVAKAIGQPIAKIAARVMAGESSRAVAANGVQARSSATSRSRKPCSPSPASPASTRCSARKCARPARSWASTRLRSGLRQVAARRRRTQRYLADAGLPVELVNKVAEGRPHIVDKIIDGEIALIFNTTEGWQSLKDSQSIRAGFGAGAKVPYFTTAAASVAAAEAIAAMRDQASLKSARCRIIIAN